MAKNIERTQYINIENGEGIHLTEKTFNLGKIKKLKVFPIDFEEQNKVIENASITEDFKSKPRMKYTATLLEDE